MTQERIKDTHGRTIGFTETNSSGKTTLFDSHSRTLGTEDSNGHVKDNHATSVCYGKGSLAVLLKR